MQINFNPTAVFDILDVLNEVIVLNNNRADECQTACKDFFLTRADRYTKIRNAIRSAVIRDDK